MIIENIGRRRKPLEASEVVRLVRAAASTWPHMAITIDDKGMSAAWEDGPAAATLWQVAGEPTGWTLVTPSFLSAPPSPPTRQFVARRTFSPWALGQSMVRFWALKMRQPDLAAPSDLDILRKILDEDRDGPSTYTIADAIARALLTTVPALPEDPVAALALLGAALAQAGYDNLWDESFRQAP